MCKAEIKSLQVVFFEKPKSLKLYMLLVDTTSGLSVEGHVIRDMWAEGEHLRRFYLVTNVDAWGFALFMWDGKCLSEGAIPFVDREPYTTELTRNLLRNVERSPI